MRMYNYLIISLGLVLLLKFAGFIDTADALTWTGLGSGAMTSSLFYLAVLAVFTTAATVGAIIVGYLTKSSPESTIVAGLAGGIFLLITSAFATIMLQLEAETYIYYILFTVMSLYMMGFFVSIIDWWRGSGN